MLKAFDIKNTVGPFLCCRKREFLNFLLKSNFRNHGTFKGSDLGKEYSVKGLEQRCRIDHEETETVTQRQEIRPAMRQRQTPSSGQGTRPAPSVPPPSSSPDMGRPLSPSILEILLQPIPEQEGAPYELTHDLKKKKKKRPKL
jgi:hypothetical protein